MTREDIKAYCRKISAGYNERGAPSFGEDVQALGFIDTSQGQNGSRGIVFSTNHALLNLDGTLRIVFYRNIKHVRIIDSYEDTYSDELAIDCADEEFRISDCSLNKSELKKLFDELCGGGLRGEGSARKAPSQSGLPLPPKAPPAFVSAPAAEKQTVPAAEKPPAPVVEKPTEPAVSPTASAAVSVASGKTAERNERKVPLPREGSVLKDKEKEPPDEPDDIVFENVAPVIAEQREAVSKPAHESTLEEDDTAMRIKIQNMTPEETMAFLAESLSEINAPASDEPEPKYVEPPKSQTLADYSVMPPEPPKSNGLTVEPVWGDIYIKASRNLRELCEGGRLSMKQIEAELSDRLLDSARAFSEITSDGAKIPKVLIPKITELKAAAENFDQYFQIAEDIAVRAMFFMMYQMLSYSDRIAETPETKERLNDFFRRFGTAGITLSMLDMRV